MVNKKVIVALALLAIVNRTWGLSCLPCREVDCGPAPICRYGNTRSICGCCDECAKGPGEQCGGPWGAYGTCSQGLECQLNHNIPGSDFNKDGICVAKVYSGPFWSEDINACIIGNNNLVLQHISLLDCKLRCQRHTGFVCKSLEYHARSKKCSLSKATSSSFSYRQPCPNKGWTFTEISE